ncbi:fluoride efflux transporter CrcB [Helicobacter felis]|uniref:Fluoride-specific ion channel FluC n=1 Tax=Helicobacter felis (strain ATCC 49179 / CCUG 28539 / NCTC 12436 / CS1) TaxID=936155 RepID=E7A8W5_HELFC|nr:fluoride efflux transporter CrcB [Helicobacter felis]CBY83246.1 CrcB-family inner membrane protein [Helicobacter felis ATCC 49179]
MHFMFLWAALGGALGASLRYFVGKIAPTKLWIWQSFPVGTFSVNVIGCFVIGFAGHLALKSVLSDKMSVFFITGVLGGFTTFSSFGLDTLKLLQKQAFSEAIAYVLGTNILGLVCVALGWRLAKLVG